jgi:hypothetical protein
MPSFVIEAAGSLPFEAPVLRLDRINSRDLLAAARRVYFSFLAASASAGDPLGVVLSGQDPGTGRGRVVFTPPVLLPDEEFVALELLRNRGPVPTGPRRGLGRGRSLRPLPP